MERNCTGGVQVIERQTAELVFRFDGTERNGNVTVFMPPTVLKVANQFSRVLKMAISNLVNYRAWQ